MYGMKQIAILHLNTIFLTKQLKHNIMMKQERLRFSSILPFSQSLFHAWECLD